MYVVCMTLFNELGSLVEHIAEGSLEVLAT